MATALKFSVIVLALGLAACARAPEPEPAPVIPPEPVFTGKGS